MIAAVRAQPFSHSRADRHDNAQAHFASRFGVAQKLANWKSAPVGLIRAYPTVRWHRLHGVEKLCHQHLEREPALTHTISMQPNVPLKIITESLISSSLMQTEVDNNFFTTFSTRSSLWTDKTTLRPNRNENKKYAHSKLNGMNKRSGRNGKEGERKIECNERLSV